MLVKKCFAALLLSACFFTAKADPGSRHQSTANAEARSETAVPSFSGQRHASVRVVGLLSDALMLTNAQQHAMQVYTLAEYKALRFAVTPADVAKAQHDYLVGLRKVLAASQYDSYVVLCKRLQDTSYEVAAR